MMNRIIDVHGAHLLDFERFHLEHNEFGEAKALGYSVLECVEDVKKFLARDKGNVTTILPPPNPIYAQMRVGGKFDMDIFPFGYENTQMLQAMTFLSKLGLETRVIPYFGFSLDEDQQYISYLRKLTKICKCGLKFHPLAMQTPISKLNNSKILEMAEERKMPMLIHTGRDEYSDSRMLTSLAKTHPDVNFCAAHFGYFRKEFLEKAAEIDNLFLDTSILSALLREIRKGNEKHVNLESIPPEVRKRSFASIFNWIIDEYGLEDKILFGSDIKWTYHVGSNREKEIKFAQNLEYSKQRKEKWLYYNAKRFLGLR